MAAVNEKDDMRPAPVGLPADNSDAENPTERLSQTQTGAIATTGNSDGIVNEETDNVINSKRKPRRWYSKLNPLRLRRPPPVPEKRSVSREHGAGLFSQATFQWMSPLMMVGRSFCPFTLVAFFFWLSHLLTVRFLDWLSSAAGGEGYLAGEPG